MNPRAAAPCAVFAALALLAAGCGVPTEAAPRLIAAPSAPPPVTGPDSGPEPQIRPDTRAAQVFFVDDRGRLVGISRSTPDDSPRITLNVLMRELADGLTRKEREHGLSTALPPGMVLEVDDLHDGQATIDLSGDVPGPAGDQTVLAVAQVVLSATSVPTVTSVLLTRGGAPLDAPKIGGALTSDPLVRADYSQLTR